MNTCGCQGAEHRVLGNCLACGRIACEEEKAGYCSFCSSFWVGPLQNGKEDICSRDMYDQDTSFHTASELTKKLVQFDHEATSRTQVFDMETDFYTEQKNPWITQEAREFASQQEALQQSNYKYGHRNLGRLCIDLDKETFNLEDVQGQFDQAIRKDLAQFLSSVDNSTQETKAVGHLTTSSNELLSKLLATNISIVSSHTKSPIANGKFKKARNDILMGKVCTETLITETLDDVDLDFCTAQWSDEQDEGKCLSMHQPHASLLAYGFKRLEGRSWSTAYRGRLWIHATSKEPSETEIETLCSYYKNIYGEQQKKVPLPRHFPTSHLIGCVDLVDCVTNDEFKTKRMLGTMNRIETSILGTSEESDSQYVFLCKAPRILKVPIPLRGNRKLWNLPDQRLPTLQKCLTPILWNTFETIQCNAIEGTGSDTWQKFVNDLQIPSRNNRREFSITNSGVLMIRNQIADKAKLISLFNDLMLSPTEPCSLKVSPSGKNLSWKFERNSEKFSRCEDLFDDLYGSFGIEFPNEIKIGSIDSPIIEIALCEQDEKLNIRAEGSSTFVIVLSPNSQIKIDSGNQARQLDTSIGDVFALLPQSALFTVESKAESICCIAVMKCTTCI